MLISHFQPQSSNSFNLNEALKNKWLEVSNQLSTTQVTTKMLRMASLTITIKNFVQNPLITSTLL